MRTKETGSLHQLSGRSFRPLTSSRKGVAEIAGGRTGIRWLLLLRFLVLPVPPPLLSLWEQELLQSISTCIHASETGRS